MHLRKSAGIRDTYVRDTEVDGACEETADWAQDADADRAWDNGARDDDTHAGRASKYAKGVIEEERLREGEVQDGTLREM